jgi:hypothetical protein
MKYGIMVINPSLFAIDRWNIFNMGLDFLKKELRFSHLQNKDGTSNYL